jgi:hypothetical protein
MLGSLDQHQIEALLHKQLTGRIACCHEGIPYIVPINYVYQGDQILAHSTAGKKIDIMRKNPSVCFQVDEVCDIFNWQSVVAMGRFQEITDMTEKELTMQAIVDHFGNLSPLSSHHPSHGLASKELDIGARLELILYKIVLISKTGRFESH